MRIRELAIMRANAARELFLQSPNVRDVLLFGGLAREDVGKDPKDIDLLLVVEARIWWRITSIIQHVYAEMLGYRSWDSYRATPKDEVAPDCYGIPAVRQQVITRALDVSEFDIRPLITCTPPALRMSRWDKEGTRTPLDLLVVPPNWRNKLAMLQDSLPHSDPEFMMNVARDATPVPLLGQNV